MLSVNESTHAFPLKSNPPEIQSFSELGLDAMCRQWNGCSKGEGGGWGGGLTVTCSCSAFIYTTGL